MHCKKETKLGEGGEYRGPKITLVKVIKKDISFKEVTESIISDKIKWRREYIWLILANL